MRTISVFFAGLTIAMIPVVLLGVVLSNRRTRIMQVFPQAGVEAWSKALSVLSLAAFLAAFMFPLALISTFGYKKAWPRKTFALGTSAGAITGGAIVLWCLYVAHSA